MLTVRYSLCAPVLFTMIRTQTQFDLEKSSGGGISKTGLGSSAALVTSLVGALVTFFIPEWESLESNREALDIIHNLAQLCHSAVQRKVGVQL